MLFLFLQRVPKIMRYFNDSLFQILVMSTSSSFTFNFFEISFDISLR